jgi:hypothetical protein
VLAAIQSRQITRTALFFSLGGRGVTNTRRANGEEPDWPGLEARLQAFSEPVFTAVQASSTADGEFHRAASSWRGVLERPIPMLADTGDWVAAQVAKESAEAMVTAQRATEKAWKAADNADDEVTERIRAELQGKGRPLGDWQPDPRPSDP